MLSHLISLRHQLHRMAFRFKDIRDQELISPFAMRDTGSRRHSVRLVLGVTLGLGTGPILSDKSSRFNSALRFL